MEICPSVAGASRLDLGSPFNITKRGQDDAATEYREEWLVSFASLAHAPGNAMDYVAHGSQYVPIFSRWMRVDTEDLRVKHNPEG